MKLPDYSQAKIFKIQDVNSTKVFIGSTCQQSIKHRLKGYVSNVNKFNAGTRGSVEYVDILNGDYQISLIENFPCKCKDELSTREGKIINEYWKNENYDCVNRSCSGLTIRQHYSNELKLQQIKHAKNNDTGLNCFAKQLQPCECGGLYSNDGYDKHARTKKHCLFEQKKRVLQNKIKRVLEWERRVEEKGAVDDNGVKYCNSCDCGGIWQYNCWHGHSKTKRHTDFLKAVDEARELNKQLNK
jgi:hypothetical protein